MEIGDTLRQMRLLADLSKEQLAEMVGITVKEYIDYENNTKDIDASTLACICDAISIDIGYFLYYVNKNVVNSTPPKVYH